MGGLMRFTENMLKSYAAPLSKTEDEKCKRTIEAIRDALKDFGYTDDQKEIAPLEGDTYSYAVSMRNRYSSEKVHIFIQGSYANNTCVRNESDVDIAVVREDVGEYIFDERFDTTSTVRRDEAIRLKNSVEYLLKKKFPYQVHRGNKSIKVDGNTYRKNADTVPCIAMHYYDLKVKGYFASQDGVVILGDDGSITRNFPKQHIANGKMKNVQTNHYYKKMVRIIKKMRHLMIDCGYDSANKVSSFGLESLLWNLPNECFTEYVYYYGFGFQHILSYLYTNKDKLSSYYEANGIKRLCLQQNDIESYKQFIDDLNSFYEYSIGE